MFMYIQDKLTSSNFLMSSIKGSNILSGPYFWIIDDFAIDTKCILLSELLNFGDMFPS